MSGISKEALARALDKGDYSLHPKPDSASAEWWPIFDRIRDEEGKIVAFVRCRRCFSLLAYDSKKTGTSSLSTYAKTCRAPLPNSSRNIATMFGRSTISNVSADTKRLVTEALARMCAEDMRPFEIVTGSGFEHLCQTLALGTRTVIILCTKLPTDQRIEIRHVFRNSGRVGRVKNLHG